MDHKGLFPKSVHPGLPRLGTKPDGWITLRLGEVLEVKTRPAEIKDQDEYQLVTAKRSREGIVSRGIKKGASIKVKSQFYIAAGDFLISRRQIVHGGCGIVPHELDSAIVSNEYLSLQARNGLSQGYLKWLSHTVSFQQTCFHASIGVHVEKMVFKPERWFRFRFHFPPIEEQQNIVEVLDTWDTAIVQTEKLIEAKRKLKKGLMQQLLTGKQRFVGDFSKPKTIKLGAVANIRRGASPRPIDDPKWFSATGRGWVRISDVTACTTFLRKTSQYLSALGESKSVKVNPGDLIMSICATIGVPRIVDMHACIHDGFVVLRDFEDVIDKYFLFHYISFITHRLAHGGQPGTQRNLNTSIVGNILIPKIPLHEQKKVSAVLDVADSEITLLSRQLEALKQQKRGLMQKLLTGQIRIKATEELIA